MKALIIFLLAFNAHAYLQKRGGQGRGLSWPSNDIDYYLNTSNCPENLKEELKQLADESAREWSDSSSLALRVNETNAGPSADNDIYCSSMSSSAVVGVTRVIYNEGSGQIFETDITINKDFSFSLKTDEFNYVGNVLTHELGHSVGFDHAESFRSSMFYVLFLGQSTLSPDDQAGAYSLYKTGENKGTIKGKVIGGKIDSTFGIFGSQVQAFSTQTGQLMGSAVTTDNGLFKIEGLSRDDQYFLYVKPLEKLDTISKYYSSAQTGFCGPNSARDAYRGTFFTTCDTTPGYPQGINLAEGTVDVGLISVYCELREVKLDREEEPGEPGRNISSLSDLEVNGFLTENDFGSTFVSYFTPNELRANDEATNTVIQEFEIDLSATEIVGENYFLDVKLTSQDFYSQIQLTLNILNNVTGEAKEFSTFHLNEEGYLEVNTHLDGAPNLNLIGRVPLNATDTSSNVFKITISAKNIDFDEFNENELFPDNDNFKDPIGLYLGIISISDGDNNFKAVMQKDYGIIRNNLTCPGGPNTLPVSAMVDQRSTEDKDDGVFSCGSIEPQSGGGNGPLSLGLGFLLALLVSRVGHDNLKKTKTHGGD